MSLDAAIQLAEYIKTTNDQLTDVRVLERGERFVVEAKLLSDDMIFGIYEPMDYPTVIAEYVSAEETESARTFCAGL